MIRRFPAVLILARRFLLSKASDQFLSFIAWVSIVGVMLGVMALTVVTSVINGFEGELVRAITGMHGDVVLFTRGEPISDPQVVKEKIRKIAPEVVEITDSFVTELMVSGPNGVAGGILEGIDIETSSKVTHLADRMVIGKIPLRGGEVVLGSAIADRIGAKVGDGIRLVIPFLKTGESSVGGMDEDLGVSKVIQAVVAGIFKMGMYEYDSKFALASLGWVQGILDQPGRVTSFKLKLNAGVDGTQISGRLSKSFGHPFRAKSWAQMNKNLFYAIKLEKAVIAIILTVIIVVAAFNVVSTLMMMIHDKTKEIAILKAMGFQPIQGFQLFCLIGVGMGFVGAVFGAGLGLLLAKILEKTQFIQLPEDIYYIGFLPVVVRWGEVYWIMLIAIFISFLATLYPAWKISRGPVLEGLRYE